MNKGMKISEKAANEPKPLNKKAIMIGGALAVVLVAAVVFFAVSSALVSNDELEKLLSTYYTANFKSAKVSDLCESLAPQLRDEADMLFTLGGVSNILLDNKRDVITELGEEYDVSIKIVEKSESTAQLLNQYSQTFPGLKMVVVAEYDVILTNGEKTVTYMGAAPFVKLDNKWYIGQSQPLIYKQP